MILELMVKQKALNDYIIQTRGLKFNDGELLKNMILACHDEILEVREDELNAEEYIDVLHFVLSIMVELKLDTSLTHGAMPNNMQYMNIYAIGKSLQDRLLQVTRLSKCFKHWSDKKPSQDDIVEMSELLLEMVDLINTACIKLNVDMKEEYDYKYAVNIQRQKEGY